MSRKVIKFTDDERLMIDAAEVMRQAEALFVRATNTTLDEDGSAYLAGRALRRRIEAVRDRLKIEALPPEQTYAIFTECVREKGKEKTVSIIALALVPARDPPPGTLELLKHPASLLKYVPEHKPVKTMITTTRYHVQISITASAYPYLFCESDGARIVYVYEEEPQA